MNLLLRTTLVLLVFVSANSRAEPFPEMDLAMGIYRIEAEVAATDGTRQRGLMFREKMPANHGILFVFPESRQECMWMKNTLLPLSVAFLDDKGVIVNIEEMAPQTLNNHCSAGPIRFALEMNAGWFKQHGFGPGITLHGLERAPLSR